ncbi:beta strand repeat-containing protein [Rhodopseudomonas palustris]|uniref:beta strand repeat-containing protein n=1 Tax=Rhodopseudomonas palustris TaxID=1076 RepID=UPI0012EE5575
MPTNSGGVTTGGGIITTPAPIVNPATTAPVTPGGTPDTPDTSGATGSVVPTGTTTDPGSPGAGGQTNSTGGSTTPPAGPATPDTDLNVALGAANVPLLNTVGSTAAVSLDPVETLLGRDIDIDLGAAIDLAPVTATVANIGNGLGDVVGNLDNLGNLVGSNLPTTPPAGPATPDTDLNVALAATNVPLLNTLGAAVAVPLDPVESLLGRDIDIDLGAAIDLAPVTAAVASLGDVVGSLGNLVGGNLPTPPPAGPSTPDTDLNVALAATNVPLLNTLGAAVAVPLDPVESFLGRDIDIDLGAAIDLAPVNATVANVGDVVGSLGNLLGGGNLANTPPAGPSPSDTDLNLSLGATNVPLLNTLGAAVAVPLDPVESLLGRDINIDLGAAIDLAPVTATVANVGDVVGSLGNLLVGGNLANTPPAGPSPSDTDLNLSLGATNVPLLNTLGAAVAVPLDPVESLLGRDIDIDLGAAIDLAPVTAAVASLGDVVGNLLGGGNLPTTAPAGPSTPDTDLNVALGATNVPLLNTLGTAVAVPLDPVESLLGRDIDIDLAAAIDLAPVNATVANVGDVVGSLGNLLGGGNLANTPPAGPSPSDTDLNLSLGATNVPLLNTLGAAVAVPLDPVESLLGRDIDIDLGAAIDLAPVTATVANVGDVVGSLGNLLGGGNLANTPPAGPSPSDTDLNLSLGATNVPLLNTLGAAVAVPLDPVESLLGRDIDIDIAAAIDLAPVNATVANIGDGLGDVVGRLVGGNLANTPPAGPSPSDTDLNLSLGATNVPLLNTLGSTAAVSLDPVETLLGRDIDIDLGAALNLAPVTGTVANIGNGLGDVVGNLGNLDNLVGGNLPAGPSAPDTDLNVALGATNVPLLNTLGAAVAVPLDPVETLLGRDIDIDVGAASDLAPVTAAVASVGDGLGGLVDNLGSLGGSTPPAGPSSPDTDLNVALGATNVPLLNTVGSTAAVSLDPVETLLGRDIDIDVGAAIDLAPVTATVANIGNGLGDVVGNLLGGGNLPTTAPAGPSTPDTDLNVALGATNVPLLNTLGAAVAVPLDPVESLLGRDINIDLGAAIDLAPVNATVANVGDVVGSLGNLVGGNLANTPPAGPSPSDTDLNLSLGATNVPLLNTLGAAVAVPLDPVESLLGRDIDIDVGLLANLDVLSSGLIPSSAAAISAADLDSSATMAATSVPVAAPLLATAAAPIASIVDIASGLTSATPSSAGIGAVTPAATSTIASSVLTSIAPMSPFAATSSATTATTDVLAKVVSGAIETMSAIDSHVASTTSVLSSSLSSTLSTLNGGNFSISGLSLVAPSISTPSAIATTDTHSVLGSSSVIAASTSLLTSSHSPTTSTPSVSVAPVISMPTAPTPTGSTSLLAALTAKTVSSFGFHF